MVREFETRVSDEDLADAERRLRATRWLDQAGISAPGYGMTVGTLKGLCDHWLGEFDWRATEARINAQPNVIAEIDGLEVHAVHRRSSRPDAIPVLLIHGWPTSFLEFLGVCDALAEPASGAQAFHVIAPSLPGYGFSSWRPGMNPQKIAELFAALMNELGHQRYIIQGGNWGTPIGTEMARQYPERVIGLLLNSVNGAPSPDDGPLSVEDRELATVYSKLLAYPHFNLVSQTPFTVSHAMNDSPAGTLAWVGEWLLRWADGDLPGNPGLSARWLVETAALYWFTGTAASAASLYRDTVQDPPLPRYVSVPTGVTRYAKETVIAPRPWVERDYNVASWVRQDRGGHFPALEVPDLFCQDLRDFAAMLLQNGQAG